MQYTVNGKGEYTLSEASARADEIQRRTGVFVAVEIKGVSFANGAGSLVPFTVGGDTYSVNWNGIADGCARRIPHARRWSRGGKEYASRAAMFRAIEASHK